MAKRPAPDIYVLPRGTITYLRFNSRRARAWARENVPDYHNAPIDMPCEPRMAYDICEAMAAEWELNRPTAI